LFIIAPSGSPGYAGRLSRDAGGDHDRAAIDLGGFEIRRIGVRRISTSASVLRQSPRCAVVAASIPDH
jgi:hypothetical protein